MMIDSSRASKTFWLAGWRVAIVAKVIIYNMSIIFYGLFALVLWALVAYDTRSVGNVANIIAKFYFMVKISIELTGRIHQNAESYCSLVETADLLNTPVSDDDATKPGLAEALPADSLVASSSDLLLHVMES
jgi:hypothetical protein